MLFFGNNKDKELEKWRNDHIDMPHDTYVYDPAMGIERDKYGNPANIHKQIVDKVNETKPDIETRLDSIEKLLKVLAMSNIVTFKLTKEQIEQLDKLVESGIYKTRTEAIRAAVEDLKDNGN